MTPPQDETGSNQKPVSAGTDPMLVSYYVWYRIAGDPANARLGIAALLAAVAARGGVPGRLMVRRDDPSTWMEVYENVEDDAGFERALAACVEDLGAARWAENGARHTEAFVVGC